MRVKRHFRRIWFTIESALVKWGPADDQQEQYCGVACGTFPIYYAVIKKTPTELQRSWDP